MLFAEINLLDIVVVLLYVFATAFLVHRQTGGNLGTLVGRLARSAHDRQEFFGHLGAQTVASRYSAIGLILAVVIGLLILGASRPEYLRFFFEHDRGPQLLVAAAALLACGVLWMWRILKVNY